MSSTAALALVVASFSAGFAGHIYVSKWSHEIATEIVTGTARNAPLATTWRWRLLYGRWIYMAASMVGFGAGIAAVNFKIANLVSDPGAKMVAYFAAAISALVAASWLMDGSLEFLHLRGILRGLKRDSK